MRKGICWLLSLLLLAAAHPSAADEQSGDYSVQVSATVRTAPPQIRLRWLPDSGPPSQYVVYRKAPAATSWGKGGSLPAGTTTYVDSRVRVGTAYEYQIIKRAPHYTGYGYICSGIEVPMTEHRGKLLLVVERTYAADLTNELAQLQEDLTGDGWTVCRLDVDRQDSVLSVKRRLQAQYGADPAQVRCVFLFGHVPVPYSGDIVPDGHEPAHQGAWPCDGYYGDMEGVWTDQRVNDTAASDARNHNVPGDGKFDQSTFPAPLKLMVGRVDLANMPGRVPGGGPATFPSERELLRNYLHKDHRFRTRQMDLPRRGLVGDYFGVHDGEAFAASGWRNLVPFFGATNMVKSPAPGTWISTLSTTPCLWAYGCGLGTYESIEGFGTFDRHHTGTTVDLVSQDVKAAFVLLYGSWLGDWDAEDDLLRAVLALPSCGLASAWSGRPHWFLHPLALGETLGFGARLTQNNGPEGLYHNEVNSAAGQIHIALLGDPTLRLHSVSPPSHLTGATNSAGLALRWAAAPDAVLGYHVYRTQGPGQPFVRLTAQPVATTAFTDACPAGAANYMVRAVKLETSGSGTYFNLSQGTFLRPVHGESEPLGSPAQVPPPVLTKRAARSAAGSS